MSETERRAAQRFKLTLPLVVRWQAEPASGVVTETRDVSSRGVYFFVPGTVRKDSPVELILTLPHEITLAGPVRVRCLGRVVRTEVRHGGRVGVVAMIERYEFLRGEDAA
ncbi:MAG: PilZ domain-containing protein [Firmicutes bacterium]|nr:PilZ domain-containing protein [Bacillota bacterium]